MLKLSAFNKRVNLTGKSYAPIVATLSPSSYPCRYAPYGAYDGVYDF